MDDGSDMSMTNAFLLIPAICQERTGVCQFIAYAWRASLVRVCPCCSSLPASTRPVLRVTRAARDPYFPDHAVCAAVCVACVASPDFPLRADIALVVDWGLTSLHVHETVRDVVVVYNSSYVELPWAMPSLGVLEALHVVPQGNQSAFRQGGATSTISWLNQSNFSITRVLNFLPPTLTTFDVRFARYLRRDDSLGIVARCCPALSTLILQGSNTKYCRCGGVSCDRPELCSFETRRRLWTGTVVEVDQHILPFVQQSTCRVKWLNIAGCLGEENETALRELIIASSLHLRVLAVSLDAVIPPICEETMTPPSWKRCSPLRVVRVDNWPDFDPWSVKRRANILLAPKRL